MSNRTTLTRKAPVWPCPEWYKDLQPVGDVEWYGLAVPVDGLSGADPKRYLLTTVQGPQIDDWLRWIELMRFAERRSCSFYHRPCLEMTMRIYSTTGEPVLVNPGPQMQGWEVALFSTKPEPQLLRPEVNPSPDSTPDFYTRLHLVVDDLGVRWQYESLDTGETERTRTVFNSVLDHISKDWFRRP